MCYYYYYYYYALTVVVNSDVYWGMFSSRRCSSYQDFTQLGSSEFEHLHHSASMRDVQTNKQTEPTQPPEGRADAQIEDGGQKKTGQRRYGQMKASVTYFIRGSYN